MSWGRAVSLCCPPVLIADLGFAQTLCVSPVFSEPKLGLFCTSLGSAQPQLLPLPG